MKTISFVVLDDNPQRMQKTAAVAVGFSFMTFLGSAASAEEALDLVLEVRPDMVFLEIDPEEPENGLSLALISEWYRYLVQIPQVIVTTKNDTLCLQAFKYGVFDYFIHPVTTSELRKTLLRLEKTMGYTLHQPTAVHEVAPVTTPVSQPQAVPFTSLNTEFHTAKAPEETPIGTEVAVANEMLEEAKVIQEEVASEADTSEEESVTVAENPATIIEVNTPQPLVICVKSYGDYRYIDADEICYLQADNNSTDIHLNTGEMITAFKTLKHFEGVLQSPFIRIHNSYIVNRNYIGRIHTGNSVCHLKNSTVKLPFSKSYKDNIDLIINQIASGNYLEI
ncbi:LytTR family transcriptional regulator DNA-binding domain-containing protein [Flavobacterium sp.]|uniref:LytR/AlgR family response regulator transcription factor n=1 Tax=Flavobacterium sp. TaxID=239 RepID=UPI00260B6A0F|nr:LytTR family transcriptional regulator DNA-binding domain-containing protein [Flavobacterium sp.]